MIFLLCFRELGRSVKGMRACGRVFAIVQLGWKGKVFVELPCCVFAACV